MPLIIIDTKNKKQQRIIHAFLDSLEVDYHTEAQEDKALYNAMKQGKKSRLLSVEEKKDFLKSLKNGK
jgi:type II secretory pathway predicted ATPase ExeA